MSDPLSPSRCRVGLLLAVAGLATACASSADDVDATDVRTSPDRLRAYDTLVIAADRSPAAACGMDEVERIAGLTEQAVRARAPEAFERIVVVTGATADPVDAAHLQARLTLDRCEAGDAFARFLSAGLGPMELAGHLVLSEYPAGRTLGRFGLERRFAWGGLYGATRDLRDLQPAFAEAAARAILGDADVWASGPRAGRAR